MPVYYRDPVTRPCKPFKAPGQQPELRECAESGFASVNVAARDATQIWTGVLCPIKKAYTMRTKQLDRQRSMLQLHLPGV